MELTNTKLLFLQSDGGRDVHKQLALSGEPLIPLLREVFNLEPPFSAIRCQELSIQGRDSCEAYSDYWNTTAADDGTATGYCLSLEIC
jgi:amidase